MTIKNVFTSGYLVKQEGASKLYHGSTNTEGFAIGQKASDAVQTQVDTTDKLVVSDLDNTPNLQVGFRQYASGTHLAITNSSGEFETRTLVPMDLQASEAERGQDLAQGFDVTKVTIENREGFGTFISLSDTSGIGERPFLVTSDGKLEAFLRDA